jgi:hypothetical protein
LFFLVFCFVFTASIYPPHPHTHTLFPYGIFKLFLYWKYV